MGAAWTIAKREIKSFFVSPIAYVILGLFALISGVQFWMTMRRFDDLLQRAEINAQLYKNPEALANININVYLILGAVSFSYFLFFLVAPAISMRLLSEEKNQSTFELLMTSPISSWSIVFGKFIAGAVFLLALLATHSLFLGVMFGFGNPEPLPVFAAYLALYLLGLSLLSMGLFASSLTRYQILAFFIALVIEIVFMLIGWGSQLASGNFSQFLEAASLSGNFETMSKGLITVSSLVYFASLSIFFLMASQVSVQSFKRS